MFEKWYREYSPLVNSPSDERIMRNMILGNFWSQNLKVK